jgi:UPF0716 protein FxsA
VGWLVLFFLALPIVELWLLLVIGGQIGFWPTVGIAVATAVLGGYLAKREGRRVLGHWRGALQEGRVPDEGIVDGILILIGGVLLATPGVLTDALGFALLFPPTRRIVADRVRARLERRFANGAGAGGGARAGGGSFTWDVRVVDLGGVASRAPSAPEIIDAQAEVIEEEPKRLPR